ncbi:hypothetical protein GCM10011386_08540 [Parapedobacter defluvii]|uniref:Uncharacterized protein n=1 Tax=Parapedobacter defluvii TaxID=2045106 RepID=A0ABQ1L3C9_9SPHI|nr:hypothetical protein [Parapedobacter defluvii]GGC18983.1 hypothetical protein GCM10011386_08540 [Parapedobacter defluvii]
MKKLLTLIVGFFVILGISSCTKEEIIQQINYNKIIPYTITQNEWKPVAGRPDLWVATLDFPEIDQYVVDYGTVLVDISFGDGIYEPLTTVYDGVAYRYDYSVGTLVIDVSFADGLRGDLPQPGRADIKVILLDTEDY